MRRRNSCAYDLGAEDEERFSSISQLAGYVISSILEPPKDDDSEPEESLTGSIAAKDPAASSLTKETASLRLLIDSVDS